MTADIINFAEAKKSLSVRASGKTDVRLKDPEKAMVFPGTSLADLWRLWAKCERAKMAEQKEALRPSEPAVAVYGSCTPHDHF